jgi:N-methylhydantoinase A/oxoprolinase/acetone carboxylase beta subunit
VRVSLPVKLLELPKLAVRGRPGDALKGERKAFCGVARDFTPHAVYDRYRLPAGAEIAGPAIFEERESTFIVGAGGRVRVDDFGFLWVDLAKEQAHAATA